MPEPELDLVKLQAEVLPCPHCGNAPRVELPMRGVSPMTLTNVTVHCCGGMFWGRWQRRIDDVDSLKSKIKRMSELLALCDGRHRIGIQAPEDPAVLALCERHGFGAVMDSAQRQWARKDPVGAFTIGPCVGSFSYEKKEQ